MADLTVFLAPTRGAEEILDVLTDLSGAGMVRPFHWVRGPDVGAATGYRAVEVDDGRRRPVALQDTIVVRLVERVRLCVLVPLVASPEPVPSETEQTLVNLLSSNAGGAAVTRIRCLLTRGGTLRPDPDDVAREGWHNLLVAPERALGPESGRWVLPADTPTGEVAALLAPAVAGITGLWVGAPQCVLDTTAVANGKTVRAARAFYRRVEAGEVEHELRGRVLTTRPQLPLPRPAQGPAMAYLGDPAAACEAMAARLWDKYRLERTEPGTAQLAAAAPVGTATVLRWLPAFLIAAARSNPQRWYGSLLGWVRSAVPSRDQARAFANLPPSHAQLVTGTRPDGLPLSWDESGRIADEIDEALPRLVAGVLPSDPGPDPAMLWQDFAGGALTLADAGDRGGQEMPPAQTGRLRGVIERVDSCVPGPATDFPVLGANLAAVTGITSVQAGDVLGADALRRRLTVLEGDVGHAQARAVAEVRAALDAWEAGQQATYAYQTAVPIASRMATVGRELQDLTAELTGSARPPELTLAERDRQLLLGRTLLGVAVAGVLATLVTAILMVTALGATTGALVTLLVAALVAIGGPTLGYRFGLRRAFRELRGYRELTARVEADQPRLRHALREYRRLRDTYADYLMWSRAVAVVLADPFGPAGHEPPPGGPVPLHGLPPSTRVGHAVVDPDVLPAAAASLRTDLFVVDWLSGPWHANLRAAVGRLASGSRPASVRDEQVLGSRAYPGGDPPLRAWIDLLVREGPDRATGDAAWSELDRRQMAERMPLRVREKTEPAVPLSEFMAGVDRPSGAVERRFDAAHFTALAQTEDRARVTVSEVSGSRRGLSRIDVLVELTDAFPAWDLELGQNEEPDGDEPDSNAEITF